MAYDIDAFSKDEVASEAVVALPIIVKDFDQNGEPDRNSGVWLHSYLPGSKFGKKYGTIFTKMQDVQTRAVNNAKKQKLPESEITKLDNDFEIKKYATLIAWISVKFSGDIEGVLVDYESMTVEDKIKCLKEHDALVGQILLSYQNYEQENHQPVSEGMQAAVDAATRESDAATVKN